MNSAMFGSTLVTAIVATWHKSTRSLFKLPKKARLRGLKTITASPLLQHRRQETYFTPQFLYKKPHFLQAWLGGLPSGCFTMEFGCPERERLSLRSQSPKAQGQLTAPGLAGKVLTRTHILSRLPSFFSIGNVTLWGSSRKPVLCLPQTSIPWPPPDPRFRGRDGVVGIGAL